MAVSRCLTCLEWHQTQGPASERQASQSARRWHCGGHWAASTTAPFQRPRRVQSASCGHHSQRGWCAHAPHSVRSEQLGHAAGRSVRKRQWPSARAHAVRSDCARDTHRPPPNSHHPHPWSDTHCRQLECKLHSPPSHASRDSNVNTCKHTTFVLYSLRDNRFLEFI
jgi:hypothetical protein